MSAKTELRQIEVQLGQHYDVIVCGGGTAGCTAAIAAARNGAKTLMIERSFTCGGMLTQGNAGITKFTEHYTNNEDYRKLVLEKLGISPEKVQVADGIAKEYVDRMMATGNAVGTDGQAGSYVFTDRYASQFTMMEMLDEANVTVLYGTFVCDAVMEGHAVKGVLVQNKGGFTQYTAECVIDATADGDVAAAAGVPYCVGASQEDIDEGCGDYIGRIISAGSMFRVRGVDMERLMQHLAANPELFKEHQYGVMMIDDVIKSAREGQMAVFGFNMPLANGTTTFLQIYNAPAKDEAVLLPLSCVGVQVDGLDPIALSKAQHNLWLKIRDSFDHITKTVPGFENARMCYLPDITVRESRRFDGDYRLNGQDLLEGRDFEDSIGCGGHPIDIGPLREDIKKHHYENWRFHIPYRIMLPKGVDNLLITGRCVSATRMASGSLRPTVQCMVMGEAAGTAAALSLQDHVSVREISYKKLREILLKNGAVL